MQKYNPTPQPLVLADLQAQDINITVSDSNLKLSDALEAEIERRWDEKMIEAKTKDLNLFNGTSYRMNSFNYDDGTLNLDFSIFDFKHRHGLICMSKEGVLDENEAYQAGCHAGSTVKTSDDKYIVIKLTGKSMNVNAYEILGGMAETDILCDSSEYLFNVLYQEMEEEGGILKKDIKSCVLKMMFAGENAHTGFYFETELSASSTELQQRFTNNEDVDIESIHFYSREEYLDMLNNHSDNKRLIAKVFTQSI